MIDLRQKVILTDVDGVLLDWAYSFERWMKYVFDKEPIKRDTYNMAEAYDINEAEMESMIAAFNGSAHIGRLTPKGDAIHYVQKLYREHGFVFHAITAISDNNDIKALRVENLNRVFGSGIFEEVTCVGHNASKYDALVKYRDSGCVWVDDHMQHLLTGLDLGLDCYQMQSFHNKEEEHPWVVGVESWREIYNVVV